MRQIEQIELIEGLGITLTAEEELKKKSRKCKDRFLLNPEGMFLVVFDPIVLVTIIYSCLTSAYMVCFAASVPQWYRVSDFTCSWIFGSEIVFNCMREYRDNTGIFVRDHRLIIAKYAKSWFLFDVIASFPYALFISKNDVLAFKLLRLIRLPRMIKIAMLNQKSLGYN